MALVSCEAHDHLRSIDALSSIIDQRTVSCSIGWFQVQERQPQNTRHSRLAGSYLSHVSVMGSMKLATSEIRTQDRLVLVIRDCKCHAISNSIRQKYRSWYIQVEEIFGPILITGSVPLK